MAQLTSCVSMKHLPAHVLLGALLCLSAHSLSAKAAPIFKGRPFDGASRGQHSEKAPQESSQKLLLTLPKASGAGAGALQSTQGNQGTQGTKGGAIKSAGGGDALEGYRTAEEVTQPIGTPAGVKPCVVTLLRNQNFSAFKAPVKLTYSPPSRTKCGATWQSVVLHASAHVNETQFDRRLTVKLADVLLLVATTAQPLGGGVKFATQRDVTHLQSLFQNSKTGVAELPNVLDGDNTGVYYVTLELRFYAGKAPAGIPDQVLRAPATVKAPQNVYKAKLEVFASHYQADEFYWLSVPNSYHRTLSPEYQRSLMNGTSYREVVALLDGTPVGAFLQKPTLYSGALDPLLWQSLVGIGSLGMPLYSLDITPFVGTLVDGRSHSISLSVTSAKRDALWVVGGALLLWTDAKRSKTTGTLTTRKWGGLSVKEEVSAKASLNSVLSTTGARSFEFSGTVDSSFGKITTTVAASLQLKHIITLARSGNSMTVDFTSQGSSSVTQTKTDSKKLISIVEEQATYPLQTTFDRAPLTDISYTGYMRIEHGIQSLRDLTSPANNISEKLDNMQWATSFGSNTDGFFYLASNAQSYKYVNGKGQNCFSRGVETASNPALTGSYLAYVKVDDVENPC